MNLGTTKMPSVTESWIDNVTNFSDANLLHNDSDRQFPPFVGEEMSSVATTSFIVLGLCLMTSGIFGNLLVLVTLMKCPSLQSIHYVYVANLAIADFIIEAYSSPFMMYDFLLGYQPVVNNAHCVFNGFLVVTCYVSSLLTLASISFNRYMHVCKHTLYKRYITRRLTILLCVLVWVLSAAVGAAPLLGWGRYGYDVKTHYCGYDRTASFSYTVLISVGTIALPATAVCYFNFSIFRYIRKAKLTLRQWKTGKKGEAAEVDSKGGSGSKQEDVNGNGLTSDAASVKRMLSDICNTEASGPSNDYQTQSVQSQSSYSQNSPLKINSLSNTAPTDTDNLEGLCMNIKDALLSNESSTDVGLYCMESEINTSSDKDDKEKSLQSTCKEDCQAEGWREQAPTENHTTDQQWTDLTLDPAHELDKNTANKRFNDVIRRNSEIASVSHSASDALFDDIENIDPNSSSPGRKSLFTKVRSLNDLEYPPQTGSSHGAIRGKDLKHILDSYIPSSGESNLREAQAHTNGQNFVQNVPQNTNMINKQTPNTLEVPRKKMSVSPEFPNTDKDSPLHSSVFRQSSPENRRHRRPKTLSLKQSHNRQNMISEDRFTNAKHESLVRVNFWDKTSETSGYETATRRFDDGSYKSLKSPRRHQTHRGQERPHSRRKRQISKKELSMIKTLFIVFVCLAIFMSPYMVTVIVDTTNNWSAVVHTTCSYLAVVNNAINWMLYGLLNRSFRSGYRQVLGMLFQRGKHLFVSH